MLSKKMAVSLTSLIIIFALAVAPAMAADFSTEVSQRGLPMYMLDSGGTALNTTNTITVDLDIEYGQPVGAVTLNLTHFDADGNTVTPTTATTQSDLPKVSSTATDPVYPMRTAKKRRIRLTLTPQQVSTSGAGATMGLVTKIIVEVPKIQTTDPTVKAADNMSTQKFHTITIAQYSDTSGLPKVVSIQRLRPGSQTVVAAFQEEKITTDPFDVRVVLTRAHTADPLNASNLVEVENGTASDLVVGATFERFAQGDAGAALTAGAVGAADDTIRPHPIEGMYEHAGDGGLFGVPPGMGGNVPMPNSDDNMYRQYRVTITPHQRSADFTIKIRVKEFHDGKSPVRQTYIPPGFGNSAHLPNGRDILSIDVKGAARNLTAGYKVTIPKDWIIPSGGYLVIAQNIAGSEVVNGPGWRTNDSPRATHRTPAQLRYNVIERSDLPNLATEFLNGVVLDVVSQHSGLVVSEVMWGEDVSLNTPSNSQYIELYNPGGQYKTVDDNDATPDVNEALTLIFYRPNEFDTGVPKAGADGSLPAGITDRIGTLDTQGTYWSPVGIGQSGRSGTTTGEERSGRGDVVDPVAITSMYRMMAAGAIDATMGQMKTSWMSSAGPKSTNFDPLAIGIRHGTPGAATTSIIPSEVAAAEAKAKADAAAAAAKAAADKIATTGTYPMAGDGRVYISEVMFAGGGTLPQWIEIANGDRSKEFNLSGWTLTVDNAIADADVSIGATAKFTIPDGTTIDPSAQNDTPSTILIVTEKGRNNLTGPAASGQVINLSVDNEVDLITAGVLTGKYTLLSDMAFLITLAPPAPAAMKAPAGETAAAKATRMAAEAKAKALRAAATDMVGNLGQDGAAMWALPMNEEGGRSSIIRRHVQVTRGPAAPEDGTMEENWALASDTSFAQITHIRASSFYGAANDVGTPGFRAGGALPVELSHFRPVRQDTGAVVITWSTQSELNNAGFFIKRSNQKDGEFQVVNATMIAGAGTTSEKQFYTYTDTTAQPNIVYYYQIEDVSLDGNRQTLTRGIRLKGHIGAAGKLTSTWGELKSSNE